MDGDVVFFVLFLDSSEILAPIVSRFVLPLASGPLLMSEITMLFDLNTPQSVQNDHRNEHLVSFR